MIGEPIGDTYLILYILAELNLGFSDFVICMLLSNDIIDIDELHHLLLLHVRRIKQLNILESIPREENVIKMNSLSFKIRINLNK